VGDDLRVIVEALDRRVERLAADPLTFGERPQIGDPFGEAGLVRRRSGGDRRQRGQKRERGQKRAPRARLRAGVWRDRVSHDRPSIGETRAIVHRLWIPLFPRAFREMPVPALRRAL
jgi:hypothetical protein